MNQQQIPTASELLEELEPTNPFDTARSKTALTHLRCAYTEGRSLAVLNSGWINGSNHLLKNFIDEIGGSAFIARISGACMSAQARMHELVRPIGIDPTKLSVTDLESVFTNFLTLQKKRKQRSIVILEESKENSAWVRGRVSRLVELEAHNKFGLFVVLSRRTSFDRIATEPALESTVSEGAKHISLTPFTLADTRKFIRWRINADESADIGRILDFQAITLIHELGEGIPDAIEALCCASLELADEKDIVPVTTNIVMQASEQINLQPIMRQSVEPIPTPSIEITAAIPTLTVPQPPKISVSYKGRLLREIKVDKSRLTIGRSAGNDLCIASPYVSREHAAIIRDGLETAVVDLDSQNGTYVNASRIRAHTMSNGDEIVIGYHTITFSDPEALARVSLNGAVPNRPNVASYSSRKRLGGAN